MRRYLLAAVAAAAISTPAVARDHSWYAGIEGRYSSIYPNWTHGLHRDAYAVSAGPTIAYKSEEWSASLTFLISKLGMHAFSPLVFGYLRVLGAAIVLNALLPRSREPWSRGDWARVTGYSVLGVVINQAGSADQASASSFPPRRVSHFASVCLTSNRAEPRQSRASQAHRSDLSSRQSAVRPPASRPARAVPAVDSRATCHRPWETPPPLTSRPRDAQ